MDTVYFTNFRNLQPSMKGQNAIVEGFITTDDIDFYNEKVTPEAMETILKSLQTGNVKLDIEHSQFLQEEGDLPIGKIVEAKSVQEDGKNKIWVKGILNKAHKRFGEVWDSIKGGFIDGFSIAYNIKERAQEVVNGTTITLLKGIELLNVALTGNPVNPQAGMTASYMKAKYIRREGTPGNFRYFYNDPKGDGGKKVEEGYSHEQSVQLVKEIARMGDAMWDARAQDYSDAAIHSAFETASANLLNPGKHDDALKAADKLLGEISKRRRSQKKKEAFYSFTNEEIKDEFTQLAAGEGRTSVLDDLWSQKGYDKNPEKWIFDLTIEDEVLGEMLQNKKPTKSEIRQSFETFYEDDSTDEIAEKIWDNMSSKDKKKFKKDLEEAVNESYKSIRKNAIKTYFKNQQGGIPMAEEEPKQDPAPEDEQKKAEDKKKEDDTTEEETKSVSLKEYTELKAIVEEQTKVIAEMKSFLEKPQLKSLVEPKAEETPAESEKTPLQMIA